MENMEVIKNCLGTICHITLKNFADFVILRPLFTHIWGPSYMSLGPAFPLYFPAKHLSPPAPTIEQ